MNLVVTIEGGDAWLKVWVDGALDPSIPQSGKVLPSGRTITFTGATSVEVRTGSSGFTHFTLNGVSLGALGQAGHPRDVALPAAGAAAADRAPLTGRG